MAFPKRMDFTGAVAAGVIDAETATRLAAFYDNMGLEPASDPDDERFPLVTGFNDVFVTTGIVLLFGSLLIVGSVGAFVVAVAAWGLAEIFTRGRRMALPSIVLAMTFVCAAILAVIYLTAGADLFSNGFLGGAGFLCAFAAIGAAAAHYWRFRVAIDVSLGVCGVGLALLLALLNVAPQFLAEHHGAIAFAFGVTVFFLAMHFDRSDPERKTHRADIAFWLHLQAAALVANGMLGGVLAGGLHSKMSAGAAVATVILATLFTLVAIVVDRRALIVSSLSYVGGALMLLIKDDPRHDGSFVFIVMLLGAAVLALSVGWRAVRLRLLSILPLDLSKARLPPAHIGSR